MRARMVERSWAGMRVPAIADELGCGQKTVRRWLHRFNRTGWEGLEDLGGQGRKRRITEAERSRIIALVKQVPPGRLEVQPGGDLWAADEAGPAEWTLDCLAAQARQLGIEVSRSQVRRILIAEGVSWRRTRYFTSPDAPDSDEDELELPVESWREDGAALAWEGKEGQLVPAAERPDFLRVVWYECLRLRGVLPGNGWRLGKKDALVPLSTEVVAFLVYDNFVRPVAGLPTAFTGRFVSSILPRWRPMPPRGYTVGILQE